MTRHFMYKFLSPQSMNTSIPRIARAKLPSPVRARAHVTKKAVNVHDNARYPLVMSDVSELPITPGNLL